MTTQVIILFLFAMASGTLMSAAMKYLTHYNALWMNTVAMIVSAVILFTVYMFQKQSWEAFQFHRWMIVLWLALAGLNFWYSAIYGQGVALPYVPIIVTWGMTVLLWIIGYFFFQEAMSWKFVVWSIVILIGMGIMVWK